ncbi:HlyD family efflux transporter periplasmic adaptor subunit [Limnohabitans sp. 2KL-17]|uniref:HlyD family efflux transporter periplasmic adaptor subunit n=1 Tax=Limnohabitans sp. 2KL-17 TaxID=1100704 RepID=UPI000D3A6338|nr:HlyD family efflux transporter periplasmic adaptor subunit [Limnohabitans sp. 2KL-17]
MISDPLKSRLAGAAQDIVDLELKPKFKGSSEPIRHNNLHDLQAPTRARSVMGVIIVSLIALTVWAAFGKIDQVTRAQAVLMSAERTQLVQTPDGGVLTELHVKEGQHVKAGQLLARLQKERAAAGVSDSSAKVAALRITLARLHAEVYGTPLQFSGDLAPYAEYIRNQRDLYNKRQTAFKEDLQALANILVLAEEEMRINHQLEATSDVSRAEVLRLERGVADIKAQITGKRNKYFQDAQAEMTKAQEDLSSQNEQLRDRQQVLENTELVAPMDGVINSIKVTTIGGVVRPGETLIDILPSGENLIVEAKIPPADMAFIALGQDTSIKLDAYDSAIFGGLRGKVDYISAEALFAEKASPGVPIGPNNPPIYYLVRMHITGTEFHGDKARDIKLRAGLTAGVEIKALERTVLSYLTKPITKTMSSGLGER